MQLNSLFVSKVQDIYGEAGKKWLAELPHIVAALEAEWHFAFLKPLPCLSYNFVGLVKMRAKAQNAVLKLVPPGGKLLTELRWLASIKAGVPEIYQADEKQNAFLMECLEPGTPLKQLVINGKDEAATRIICKTILELQVEQETLADFEHLSELIKDLSILKGHYDARLLAQAQTWFHDLTQDRSQDLILHGDLHHDNILESAGGWKAIDPHGYRGDPVAEVGAMIRNPLDSFPKEKPVQKIVERRLQLLAAELPFDAQRIKAWAFCMTVLSVAWTFEGHGHLAPLEMEVAAAIDKAKV
jgi:streptomycin 6-kinase